MNSPDSISQNRFIPRVTTAVLVVLVFCFISEIYWGILPWSGLLSPDIKTLIVLGGVAKDLVESGEWYRLLTATFLHGGLIHLLFNGIALLMIGNFLETFVGRTWFFFIYGLSGLGGSLLGIIINPSQILSVGASGAIMGLFAAGLIYSFKLPVYAKSRIQRSLIQVLIPSLLPIFSMLKIDYAAHLGGALTGCFIAGIHLLLLKINLKKLRFIPIVGSLILFILIGISFVKVVQNYPLQKQLMLEDEVDL